GINVIKLYAGNPDLNAGAPGTAGNWKAFLDYCYNSGNKPIYVVMFSYTQGGVIAQGGTGFNDYVRQYDELVKSTIKHPAVFGYLVGNEIFDGVTQNQQFWTNFGKLIDAAQGAGLSQSQNPFLMTAINDEFTPQTSWPAIKLGEQSGKLRNLDSWCINIYRGAEFGGAGNSVFTQYLALMNSFQTPLKKPLILGEWGTPHTTRPIGVTSAVDQSAYGQSNTNISHRLYKGYSAVKTFYLASTESGDELYLTGEQIAAIKSNIQVEIHQDRKELKRLGQIDVRDEVWIR